MQSSKYVFISYKIEDKADALWIKSSLEHNGILCWMAPYSILGGSNYASEIDNAIRNCSVFVLVSSPNVQNSIWIPKEVDRACNYGKTIMPFMLGSAEYPENLRLYLTNVQGYDATGNKTVALQKLILDIRREFELQRNSAMIIGKPPKAPAKEKKSGSALKVTFVAITILIATLITAVLCMVAVKFIFFPPTPDPIPETTTEAPVEQTESDVEYIYIPFELEGEAHHLPCYYEFFKNNGWVLVSDEVTEETVLENNTKVEVILQKGDRSIVIDIVNDSGAPRKLKNNTVTSICTTVFDCYADLITASGVTFGISRDTVINELYGEPDNSITNEIGILDNYYLDEEKTILIRIIYDSSTLLCNGLYLDYFVTS